MNHDFQFLWLVQAFFFADLYKESKNNMSVIIYLYDTDPRDVVVGYGAASLGGWVKRLQTGTDAPSADQETAY